MKIQYSRYYKANIINDIRMWCRWSGFPCNPLKLVSIMNLASLVHFITRLRCCQWKTNVIWGLISIFSRWLPYTSPKCYGHNSVTNQLDFYNLGIKSMLFGDAESISEVKKDSLIMANGHKSHDGRHSRQKTGSLSTNLQFLILH